MSMAPSSSIVDLGDARVRLLELLEQVLRLLMFLQQAAALCHQLLVLQALQDGHLQFFRDGRA